MAESNVNNNYQCCDSVGNANDDSNDNGNNDINDDDGNNNGNYKR